MDFKIEKPTKQVPGGHIGKGMRSEITIAVLAALAQLQPGEFLPVVFPDVQTATRWQANAMHSDRSALHQAGVKGTRRGNTVYVYRNGVHG